MFLVSCLVISYDLNISLLFTICDINVFAPIFFNFIKNCRVNYIERVLRTVFCVLNDILIISRFVMDLPARNLVPSYRKMFKYSFKEGLIEDLVVIAQF